MYRLFVRHKVHDFDRWHEGYRDGAAFRNSNAVRAEGVHTVVDNPADVTVWHDFDNRGEAEAFAASAELAQKMEEIGVEGRPEIWITETR
jgi:head-tail adaptor